MQEICTPGSVRGEVPRSLRDLGASSTRRFQRLDEWIRRKLRVILWRQWKRPPTRRKELAKRGLAADRAAHAAGNGRGPWWNAGATHMNQAVPTSALRRMGLISLIDEHRRLVRYS